MDLGRIIAEIDAQIERLQKTRAALIGNVDGTRKRSSRKISPAARRRLSAATKARWAKAKKAGKTKLG